MAATLVALALATSSPTTPSGAGSLPSGTQALAAVQRAAAATRSSSAAVVTTLWNTSLFGTSSPVRASTSFDFSARRGTVFVGTGSGQLQERAVYGPNAVFTRPGEGTSLPAGKTWIMTSFSNQGELARDFPEFIGQIESLNPGLAITALALGATSASPASSDVLDGVSVTRIDVAVDLRRALSRATAAPDVPFALALQSWVAESTSPAGAHAPAKLAVRVWLSKSGLLLGTDFTAPESEIGPVSLRLSGYGTGAHTVAPPPGAVIDLGTFAPGGEREDHNDGDGS